MMTVKANKETPYGVTGWTWSVCVIKTPDKEISYSWYEKEEDVIDRYSEPDVTDFIWKISVEGIGEGAAFSEGEIDTLEANIAVKFDGTQTYIDVESDREDWLDMFVKSLET